MSKNIIKITQKMRAWVLWEAGHRTAKSMLRRGKIPIRSAERYISEFRDGGDWRRKDYSPRVKPQQTKKKIRKVVIKARSRKKIYSLKQMGRYADVSPRTAKRILKSQMFAYKNCRKNVYLNEKRRKNRVLFAEKMQEEDPDIWNRVLISDECTIWLNRSRPSKLWTQDAMIEEGNDVHGPKVHCWGGITAKGALSLEIFEDNLESSKYLQILKKKVIEMDSLYPEGWIFQQDGSGVHRAGIIEDFIDTFQEEPIEWPPYSPDLSPIENIWAWLKNEVSKDMPTSIQSLKRCIRKHWNRIDCSFLTPYFMSMPRRIDLVLESDGRKIKY